MEIWPPILLEIRFYWGNFGKIPPGWSFSNFEINQRSVENIEVNNK